MLKKLFAAALLIAGISASAANIISLDLNFYSTDGGTVKVAGKLPPGVTMQKRKNFSNPALKGFAYPIRINFDKVKTVELKFVVVSGSGKIAPSLSGYTTKANGKRSGQFVYKCTKFEFCDEPTTRQLPLKVVKWINMLPRNVEVTEGDTVTVIATFDAAD